MNIPIFFTFDENYSAQFAVTLYSLLLTKDITTNYSIIVYSTDLSNKSKDNLLEIFNKYKNNNDTIKFINFKNTEYENSYKILREKHKDIWMPKLDVILRCYASVLPELLEYDKIIYSDVDILIKTDISEIYHIDINNVYLSAYRHPKFQEKMVMHIDDINIRSHYFGSGLLVMNLKKMREESFDKIINNVLINDELNIKYSDQDILNYACNGQVNYIPFKYVSIPALYNDIREHNFVDEYYSKEELETTVYNPSIIHYCYIKPWNKNLHTDIYNEEWFYWYEKANFHKCFKEIVEHNKKIVSGNIFKAYLFKIIPLGKIKLNIYNESKLKIKIFNKIPIVHLYLEKNG